MSRSQQEDGRFIGRRVRAIRARRGITQQVLADRVGLSRGAIAKFENGERPVDSRRTLYALAAALGVRVADLTGHPLDQTDPSASAFHAAVGEIEAALWMAGDVAENAETRSLGELAVAARRAGETRLACDFIALGPMLAPLITDCYRHTRSASEVDRVKAWNVLASVAFDTAIALRVRGYGALAWTAAQAIEQAAQSTGDTAGLAAAAFARSQVLLSRPGSLSAALGCAVAAADKLQSTSSSRGELETYGMLHLQSALTAAALGKDASGYFDEAEETADRLAEAVPGESMMRNPTFGPENVTLWRMSAAMEQRESGRVLELAPIIDPNAIEAPSRRAQYFVEIGRAHALQRNYRESLHALLRAEHIGPQHVRGMSHVRELVGHMMRTARRDLTTGELGRLAQRVGVVPV
ncbi:helix-turn-helix transcriptional regulator [Nocardia sp. CDC186]|uniref:Helix-turn-helix transcriptional regulator n=1 Tax=Nocardia implantans TaxID=3108168 RepID=A0ABU6AYA0_9NOCA|nr:MULTISPECIES: helix-turn-helix transcriptional regulator [unclassified Nocardia]MBF6190463.1 helix-turn-helix transcriptional regulator [Nocardia beijingensis]MEA3528370.1 helix-turn-helix transcriptional regulator [Nocardia sp. CDC192]MEB3512478.1 helix-turn-helix transcriptional regulator [Nocardia sp. CDC186]